MVATEPDPAGQRSLFAFFLLAFAVAWGLWIPSALAAQGLIGFPLPTTLAGVLGAWGPSLAAIIVTAVALGGAGLRGLMGRVTRWRVGVQWYLFALLWPAALSLLTTGVSLALGSPAPDFGNPPVVSAYPVPPEAMSASFLPLLPMVFIIQFLGSSLGEEIGWRGFALPRLQAGRSALAAGAIVGLIWGLWHLPRMWAPGEPFDLAAFAWLVVELVLNGILYAWLFNNTKGSLLPVLLLHTAQAVTSLFLAQTPSPFVATSLTALLVVLVVAVYGPAGLSRSRRRAVVRAGES